jgi:hypothetical protein
MDQDGGGIRCVSSSPTITNCVVSWSFADNDGGGIACHDSSPAISNCVIRNNFGDDDAGGIYITNYSSPTITNCTIVWNQAPEEGGAVMSEKSSSPTLTNCILWDNLAPMGSQISIGWWDEATSLTISYSLVQDGQADVYFDPNCTGVCTLNWGPGNIDTDPLFPGGSDYHLTPTSPCIDTGTSSGAPDSDIDGDSRPQKSGFDMGADESAIGPIVYVGPNPTDDYPTIQQALDDAVPGISIIVRDGVYTGTLNKNLDFGGKALTLRSENGPENCIIDCQDSGRGFYFHNGESLDSTLDGFTIMNGNASTPYWPEYSGGGILCINASSPTIVNCIIQDNYSYDDGGGIACINYSSPAIVNSVIRNNDNDDDAGGIVSAYDSNPTIRNCSIIGNSSIDVGGGVISDTAGAALINCIVWGNTAPNGSQMGLDRGGSLTVSYSDVEGGQGNVFVSPIYCIGCVVDWGIGNIDANPLFAGVGDYHLSIGSPCIDTATSSDAPDSDIDGDIRPQGAGYDMGADEF